MNPISPAWAQAGFTFVLVVITGIYAWATHRHVKLVKNQINREARRHHSEILKQKVDEWLENLPSVRGARPESALRGGRVGHPFFREEYTFWTIPVSLEEDVFFQDFLDNHAEQCKQLKNRIETNYKEFQDLREEFYKAYDSYEHLEDLQFNAEPLETFPLWVFESGVIMERGTLTREEQKENLEMAIENDKRAQRPPRKKYPSSLYGWDNTGIVEAEVFEKDRLGQIKTLYEREDGVIQALHDTIDDLPQKSEYELVEDAAESLSQVEEDILELERELKKFKGMEIIPGDCDYIVGIDDDDSWTSRIGLRR